MKNDSQNFTNVKVWHIEPESIHDAATCELLVRWLSDEERERMQTFRAQRHRHAYLVSHALVRGTLAAELSCEPTTLRFETNAFGKPTLIQPASKQPLEFNLSHTEGLSVVALSWQSRLGCDVEQLNQTELDVEIARLFFTQEESQEIATQPTKQQSTRLLSYWTLKEAYIKAEGKGLSMDLDTFYFSLQKKDSPRLILKNGAQQPSSAWKFKQIILKDRFLFSLAVEAMDLNNECEQIIVEYRSADWISLIAR